MYRFLSLAIASCCFTTAIAAAASATHGQHHQAGYRSAAQAAEPALLAQVLAGQFVFGFAVDRGGQVGDLLPEQRCRGIPRGVVADVDVERLGRQNPGLGQHRQRRIRAVRVKPCRVFVPGRRPPATTNSSWSGPRRSSQ